MNMTMSSTMFKCRRGKHIYLGYQAASIRKRQLVGLAPIWRTEALADITVC